VITIVTYKHFCETLIRYCICSANIRIAGRFLERKNAEGCEGRFFDFPRNVFRAKEDVKVKVSGSIKLWAFLRIVY
jgi:hypothetical protein